MAELTWFSHDQPQLTDDPVSMTVRSATGNWLQGQGGERPVDPRYVYSWRVDGGPWTAPAVDGAQGREDGVFKTLSGEGESTFSYAGLPPGKHLIECQVSAGTYSLMIRSDGTVAWEAYEWGTGRVTNPDEPLISSVEVEVFVSEVPPPQTGDRRLSLDPRLPEIRDNTLAEFAQAKASFARWKAANPGEWEAVDAMLAMAADDAVEGGVVSPSLRTHKGRGIVGMLQAGAATIGRLP